VGVEYHRGNFTFSTSSLHYLHFDGNKYYFEEDKIFQTERFSNY
jgi:hypothetical protein